MKTHPWNTGMSQMPNKVLKSVFCFFQAQPDLAILAIHSFRKDLLEKGCDTNISRVSSYPTWVGCKTGSFLVFFFMKLFKDVENLLLMVPARKR